MTGEYAAYLGLFLAALGAATLLPMQSEAVLIALIASQNYSVAALLTAATLGNVLGSVVNWGLGRSLPRWQNRRWFPISPQSLERATQTYQGYGYWSLLLCWLPIIGDPLTLIAGVLKEPFWRFLGLVTLAKLSRYAVLAAVTYAGFA